MIQYQATSRRFQYVVTTYFLRLSGPVRPPFSDKFDQMDWLFGQADWLCSCNDYEESGMIGRHVPDNMVFFSNSPYGRLLGVENWWNKHIATKERERKDERKE